MNKETKKQTEELVEVKYRNKEELAKSKQELLATLQDIKKKTEEAKKVEKELRLKAQKEHVKDKAEEKKLITEQNEKIRKEKELLAANKKQLDAELKKYQEQVKLHRAEERKAKAEADKAAKAKVEAFKAELKIERELQKNRLIEKKQEAKKLELEAQEKIAIAKQDLAKFKINQEKLINARKVEIAQQQSEFAKTVADVKIQKATEKSKKLAEAKLAHEQLKLKEAEEKAKYNQRMLELKGKALEDAKRNTSNSLTSMIALNVAEKELDEAKQKAISDLEEIKKQTDGQIAEGIADIKSISLAQPDFNVNINDIFKPETTVTEVARKAVVQEVGKVGIKLFEKVNADSTHLTIAKLDLPQETKDLIVAFQNAKATGELIDIKEFVKYASYVSDREVAIEGFQAALVSVVANLLNGRTLSFLDGYFRVINVKKYRTLIFDKNAQVSDGTVMTLPDTKFANAFEKAVADKLNKGGFIVVSNNIALKKINGKIEVITDLPFLER